MDIIEFYRHYKINPNFKHEKYRKKYPETDSFYQPFCLQNNISDKYRLYFHYAIYGTEGSQDISRINKFYRVNINPSRLESIDKVVPVHPNFLDSYNKHVNRGKFIAAASKIAVVSLARNCDSQIASSIDSIHKLHTKEMKFFVFENDSSDNTKEIIKACSKKNTNFYFKTEDNKSEYLQDRSEKRTSALAKYRNKCISWVRKNCKNFDMVIVLDLDADLGFSIDGIYNSISWLHNINDAGGIASYSLYARINEGEAIFAHYDSFASRMNDWQPTSEDLDQNNAWFRHLHPYIGSDPFHMRSCFGGLAVYKTEAFLSGEYGSDFGSEHVKFHKDLYDKGYKMYLNPSSRFFAVYDNEDFF